jgi:hypothetical protein
MVMYITGEKWDSVRDNFSEAEKQELRKANIGESICPRGFSLDLGQVSPALSGKVIKFCVSK